jgi:hypothetical protein
MDLTRVFHSAAAKYTFFSAANGTFSKIEIFYDIKQILANIMKLK